MKNRNLLPVSLALAWMAAAACSTVPSKPLEPTRNQLESGDSSVLITYVLGHAHRKFSAAATSDAVTAQAYLDRAIIEEGKVDVRRYVEFVEKAQQFVANPKRGPASSPSGAAAAPGAPGGGEAAEAGGCRTPFTVTVRVGKETQSVSGCRATDEGALSHLVRDGEFLLYSKK